MFPLAGSAVPSDPETVRKALAGGLESLVELRVKTEPVEVSGSSLEQISILSVVLDQARIDPASPPAKPVFGNDRTAAFTAKRFEIQAMPLLIGDSPVQFKLTADNVNFEYATDADSTRWLLPSEDSTANNGSVSASVGISDLKDLLVSVLGPLAKAQGISIVDLDISVQSIGPRSVKAVIEATGKKFGMKAKVQVHGQVDIDDQLNATLSNLKAGGEGFLGSTVSGLLQPKLRQYDGSRFPLAALSLGGLKLRDLKVAVASDILVSAAFGKV